MHEVIEQARGFRWRAQRSKGVWVYIGPHAKTEVHAPIGYAVPGFGFGQRGGADLDYHRGEELGTSQRNGGCAAMKGGRLSRLRACPLRENNQRLAFLQGAGGVVQHVDAAIIADVLRGAHRASSKRILPKALFDHAIGVSHQANQKNHVDQRRVVSDDHLPWSAKPLGALYVIGEHAHTGHRADKQPEQPADRCAGAFATTNGIARQAAQHRKDDQAQAQAAQPEQAETDRRRDQAPVPRVLSRTHRLLCQFHTRVFQACWNETCPSSSWRSRFRACGHGAFSASAGPLVSVTCHCEPGVSSRPTA